jgi:hypothetical protein
LPPGENEFGNRLLVAGAICLRLLNVSTTSRPSRGVKV